jgi:exonuclease I
MHQENSMQALLTKAQGYTKTILQEIFLHDNTHQAVIVYDMDSPLSSLLSQAYRDNLPEAIFVDFHQKKPEEIRAIFDTLQVEDLVILIQSTNFRLDAFRIRVELFKKKIKVLEHPHLGRMSEAET